MAMLESGHRPGEVARRLGVSPAAVSQWKKLYRRAGPKGLKATPHPGPKSKLTKARRRKLERLLLKGPRAHGYPTGLWTLKRIVEVINRHFAVRYDPSGAWHLLKALGWTCRKPKRRGHKSDEDALVGWRPRS